MFRKSLLFLSAMVMFALPSACSSSGDSQEARETQATQETQDTQEAKETKESKEAQDAQEGKESKSHKDHHRQIPRLAVISALADELTKLREMTKVEKTVVLNGRSFYLGTLEGNKIVLFLSGMSMVNAAISTQTALENFQISGIVFSGIAGGVNPERNIGDVVVAEQWGQYQENLFARSLQEGNDCKPECKHNSSCWGDGIPGLHSKEFTNFGMMFPQSVFITHRGGETDKEEKKFWFSVDPAMLNVAKRVAPTVKLESCTATNECLNPPPAIAVGGNGVSGPTFVDNADYRKYVWATFKANALDMESAAVAHTAYVNKVPFIAFRSLSDLAGGGPGQNEMGTFFQLAAGNSAKVVCAFLREWSKPCKH